MFIALSDHSQRILEEATVRQTLEKLVMPETEVETEANLIKVAFHMLFTPLFNFSGNGK